MTLFGLKPGGWFEALPFTAASGGPVQGPASGDLGGTAQFAFLRSIDTGFPDTEQVEVAATNQGVENVAANGTTYACHKATGSQEHGGFPVSFTGWFNPQVGAPVRMTTTMQEEYGPLNLTYELQSTSFTL